MQKKLALALIGLVGGIAVVSFYSMYQRYTEDILWGHLPLFAFMSVWALGLLLLLPRIHKNPEGGKHMRWSVLSGLLLGAAFPPLPFMVLAFVGFVPLLLLERSIDESKTSKRPGWSIFFWAFNTFLLWNILTTHWVANTAFIAGVVAIVANSLIMCIPFMLFRFVRKTLGDTPGYTSLIAFWIIHEYIHMRWDLTWPWLTIGNYPAAFPFLYQWYEYTGVLGGSLWILWCNILLARNIIRGMPIKRAMITPVLLILLPAAFSIGIYFTHQEQGETARIAVIQPNFEPHYEKFTMSEAEQLNRIMELSLQAANENVDYIVLPETVFSRVIRGEVMDNNAVQTINQITASHPNTIIVAGVAAFERYFTDEKPTVTSRSFIGADEQLRFYYDVFNAAIQLENDTVEIPFYIKSKLVPGAELMPYPSLFSFLEPLALELGGMSGSHARQDKRDVFSNSINDFVVAPVICYESIFGDYCTEYVKRGANLIFIVTNDGWWDNTAGHIQHLQIGAMRAVELRRSIARSANTGVSGFINQRGDILHRTQYEVTDVVIGEIQANNSITFYTIWGDMIGRLAGFLAVVLLLVSIARNRQEVRKLKQKPGSPTT